MATTTAPSWTKTRSQLANALKADPEADVTELRRQLKAERLADYIRRTIDAAPPLTTEQRERLASLLRPAAPAGNDREHQQERPASVGKSGGSDAAA